MVQHVHSFETGVQKTHSEILSLTHTPQVKRNKAIDAYRITLMFGICLLHSISQAGHNVSWANNCFSWCVTAFAFISGWFGMRFSFMKLTKLYGVSLYCAAVICIVNAVFGYGDGCLKYIWDVAVGQWYLNAYAILLCLAPILNEGCRSIAEMPRNSRLIARSG